MNKMSHDEVEIHEIIDDKEIKHCFLYSNEIPINESNKDVLVNYLCYWTEDKEGKRLYYNTWVTDVNLCQDNLLDTAKSGRAYWRIENETHNTLKNQGYNFEHNFGHGEKHLASVFAHLMLLAFLIDQISMNCNLFNVIFRKVKTKKCVWEKVLVSLCASAVCTCE